MNFGRSLNCLILVSSCLSIHFLSNGNLNLTEYEEKHFGGGRMLLFCNWLFLKNTAYTSSSACSFFC